MFCCFYNACFHVYYSLSCILKICRFSCLFWIRTRFYGCVLFLVWLVRSTFLPVGDGFLHSEKCGDSCSEGYAVLLHKS